MVLENYAIPQIREDLLQLETLADTKVGEPVKDQNKRFGVLLVNLTNPFNNFGPISAGFAFNVSKGKSDLEFGNHIQ